MASSGISFTEDSAELAVGSDRRHWFILRVLEECSQTHGLAREARVKLQATIDARSAVTDLPVPEPSLEMDGEQYKDTSSMYMFDESWFDFGAFDMGQEVPDFAEFEVADLAQNFEAFTNPGLFDS